MGKKRKKDVTESFMIIVTADTVLYFKTDGSVFFPRTISDITFMALLSYPLPISSKACEKKKE